MRAIPLTVAAIVCLSIARMSAGQAAPAGTQAKPANPTQEIAKEQAEGPSLAAGPARIRLGGYLGVTGIYRSTNSGGGPATNFATIPYADQLTGNVSEARLSAQASRISLRVDAEFPEPDTRFRRLSGYFEMDFGGSTPGAVAVTTTSVGLRLRQAFAEVQYGNTFFLAAGQAFTLMTAQKNQLSMWPADLELTQAVDLNFLAGMIWNRTPQVRLAWRPSPQFNWAVSLENPEQQLGKNVVTLPACCAADLDAQYNTGSDELMVPNLMTDFVTRVAFNPYRPLHVDIGGVIRVFRHTVAPYDEDFKGTGSGWSINVRYAAPSRTTFVMQSGFGSGFGRYIGGLAPDVAFRNDSSISAIGTVSWVGGVEQAITPRISVAGYYSGLDIDASVDQDAGGYIGFGFPGASNSNNRSIQELTATGSYQFLRTTERGSGQFNVQGSWLQREPWSQGNGLPSARTFMFLAQVRYNLP